MTSCLNWKHLLRWYRGFTNITLRAKKFQIGEVSQSTDLTVGVFSRINGPCSLWTLGIWEFSPLQPQRTNFSQIAKPSNSRRVQGSMVYTSWHDLWLRKTLRLQASRVFVRHTVITQKHPDSGMLKNSISMAHVYPSIDGRD
jgi:hypothetical protein